MKLISAQITWIIKGNKKANSNVSIESNLISVVCIVPAPSTSLIHKKTAPILNKSNQTPLTIHQKIHDIFTLSLLHDNVERLFLIFYLYFTFFYPSCIIELEVKRHGYVRSEEHTSELQSRFD